MKLKEYLVLTIVIVVIGAYLFLHSSDQSQYALPELSNVSGEDISRIEITTSDDAVDLTRSDDQWRIGENSYPADDSKINNMLSTLDGLTLTALVSESVAYARYDLTDEKKITVKAWAGDRLVRSLDIGKAADTYQHTFVRISDNTNVYHAQDNFRRTFDQTVEALRDKTVLSFNTPDIQEIQISFGGEMVTVALKEVPVEIETPSDEEAVEETLSEATETAWLNGDGKAMDTDAVERLLSQLAHLTCSGYLDDQQKEDLESPVHTLLLKGNQTHTLSIYKKETSENLHPATSSQNEYPFTLSESTWTRLNENLEAFFPMETED